MNFPKNLKYSTTHEWVEELGGGKVRIGITDYAQDQLGDLVYVTLPEVGDTLESGASFADVESVKAVADILSPVNGTVSAVNGELQDQPQLMNEKPYEAWFAEAENAELEAGLMDADAYAAFCAKQG